MIKYTPQNQLSIFDFKAPFLAQLDIENRWVKMANILPWDEMAKIYYQTMSADKGAPSIDARIVLAALIIKHIEGKDDRGTVAAIQENVYMQYFAGLTEFTKTQVFDPSLFVHIRKRLGNEAFDKMNQLIIQKADLVHAKSKGKKATSTQTHDQSGENQDFNPTPNKGRVQMDATVCDVNIKFPTDVELLSQSREKCEQMIDKFCLHLHLENKPRTYRQNARRDYLNFSKNKKKSKAAVHIALKQQLQYLKRDIGHINNLLDKDIRLLGILSSREYKYWLVVQELYRQQQLMYSTKTHSTNHRIVSIHQPHIRPMVRGKQAKNTEFGPKINISLQKGYARIDQFDFEAFNEGKCLIPQIINYQQLHGHFPDLVQTDDIYMNRHNRQWLTENGIRHTGRPLGRKPKVDLSPYQKRKLREERNERNQVEGKFGQGKTKYKLNKIMAKLPTTQQSWVAAIIFIMNILKLSKDIFLTYFGICFLETIFSFFKTINPRNFKFAS
jgi:hypothetical protein